MLSDYRSWLESELMLLGNASHHAYSFGQANMAKRALERLDQEIGDRLVVMLTPAEAAGISAALEMTAEMSSPPSAELASLRARLRGAAGDTHKTGGPARGTA